MPKLIIAIISSVAFITSAAYASSWARNTLDAAAKNDTGLLAPNVPTNFH